ncbi:MAG: hypothetical protein JHD16_01815, partial [Solirubrobacteraceae bacterium]|nr:hypothetical protein [Solirubrobacteraceae bacterium]
MTDPAPHQTSRGLADVPLLPASTVMLVRDTPIGGAPGAVQTQLEVCLLLRNATSVFVGGASLFPGGALDPEDGHDRVLARCDGLTEAVACNRLRVPSGGVAHWVAAVREAFEECALLCAVHEQDGRPLDLTARETKERFAAHRAAVDAGRVSLGEVLEVEGLRLDLAALHYVAHWVTPVGAPRRYDTRFFVGPAPASQTLAHDGSEVVAAEWVVPAAALAQLEAGELSMLPPTRESLRWLASYSTAAEVLHAAAEIEEVPRYEPHFVTELDGSVR